MPAIASSEIIPHLYLTDLLKAEDLQQELLSTADRKAIPTPDTQYLASAVQRQTVTVGLFGVRK